MCCTVVVTLCLAGHRVSAAIFSMGKPQHLSRHLTSSKISSAVYPERAVSVAKGYHIYKICPHYFRLFMFFLSILTLLNWCSFQPVGVFLLT